VAGGWLLIAGVGGVGKSTVAARIASEVRRRERWSILWLGVGVMPTSTLVESFASSLGTSVRLIEATNMQTSHLRAASSQKKLLIILDDVDSDEQLGTLLACIGPGNSVLITARHQGFSCLVKFSVETLPLKSLSSADGAALLIELTGAPSQDLSTNAQLLAVADAIGNLPLAIEIIAGRVHARLSSGASVPAALSITRWLDKEPTMQAIGKIIASSVAEMNPKFSRAFAYLGLFKGVAVAKDAIVAMCDIEAGDESDEFFATIRDRMLITAAPAFITIHPEVRHFARAHLISLQHDEPTFSPRTQYIEYYKALLEQYGGYEWAIERYPLLLPHEAEIIHATDLAIESTEENQDSAFRERALEMGFRISWYLHWRGYWDLRKTLCARLLKIFSIPGQASLPSEWKNALGNLHVDIGWVNLWQNSLGEAQQHAEAAKVLLLSVDLPFAIELEGEVAVKRERFDLAEQIFSTIFRAAAIHRRQWFVFGFRLADAKLALNKNQEQEALIGSLHGAIRQSPAGTGALADVCARISLRAAKIARDKGDVVSAQSLLQESVERFRLSKIITAEAIEAFEALAVYVGDSEQQRLLNEALLQASQLGMQMETDRLRDRLDVHFAFKPELAEGG
jgi:NB-ARC domain